MKKRKNSGMKLYIGLVFFSILIPMILLCIWCIALRWPYPDLLPEGVSLRGINQILFGYGDMVQILLVSIAVSAVTGVLTVVVGTMTARALVHYEFFGKRIVQMLGLLPLVVPGTALGMGIHVLFLRLHLANTIWGVILVHLMYTMPYGIKLMSDQMLHWGSVQEEQAVMLGAGSWQCFWYVTMPLLRSGMVTSFCMGYIVSFSQYFLTLLIGGGQVKTLSVIMVPFIQGSDKLIAANYSFLFILLTIGVFAAFDRIARKMGQQGTISDALLDK